MGSTPFVYQAVLRSGWSGYQFLTGRSWRRWCFCVYLTGARRQCGGSVAELEMDILPEVSGGAAIEQDIKLHKRAN